MQSGCPARCGVKPLLIPFVLRAQSLDPGVQLSWGSSTYSADEVKNSWGTTFGGSGTNGGHIQAYASGSSQKAFDLAYMLNGKYAVKKDPTLTGARGDYL